MKPYESVMPTQTACTNLHFPICATCSGNHALQECAALKPAQELCHKDIVSDFLMSHGIYPHLLGYRYLRSALMRGLGNPYFFDRITQVCYPVLAEEFHTNAQSVERAIRHALLRAEERGVSATAKAWGHCTNREFLVRACEYISILTESSAITEYNSL